MKKFDCTLIALGVLALVASQVSEVEAKKPVFPSWSQQLTGAKRFTVLSAFGGAAVLDNETGLVWEQSPDDTPLRTWFDALSHCYTRSVGGRKGWRLPTIEELASLVDPHNPGGNPDLPSGHPFSNVQSGFYWSATTNASDTNLAWLVIFPIADVGWIDKSATLFVWCVRGGRGVEPH